MARRREEVVALLCRAGLVDLASAAEQELAEEVENPDLFRFGERHGLSNDELISRMGGSP